MLVVSTDRANLPECGEQITFEASDIANERERVTLRVSDVITEGFGYVTLVGWRIGSHGFPEALATLRLPVSTVEARRLHRRCRNVPGHHGAG